MIVLIFKLSGCPTFRYASTTGTFAVSDSVELLSLQEEQRKTKGNIKIKIIFILITDF